MSLPVRVSIAGLDLGRHHVRRMSLHEELHRPWSLLLEVGVVDADIDFERAIGAAVVVEMSDEPFVQAIHGFLRDLRQTSAERSGESTYLLQIAPGVALLGLRRAQRIFQHVSVVDIVRTLLGEHDLTAPAVRLVEEHPTHEYRVQWNESDLELILRRLADEGITLVLDPREDRARLIDDSRTGTEALDRVLDVRADATALRDPEEPPCVRRVALGRALTTGHLAVRDYDFEHPVFIPEASAQSRGPDREGRLDVYEFQVGDFHDEPGARLAGLRRLEAMRSQARTVELETNAIVPAGVRVSVAGGARAGIDGEHLVVSAETSWSIEARTTVLRCISSSVRFRPTRRPKPRVHGTQTAFVVTPDGKDVDVDVHGRVEVEFRWDRRDLHDGGISRRVRVAQPWAGAGFGMTLLPRRNEEVVIAYLDGDPDEPMVVGRVHDGWNGDPLALPAQQTQSIWKSRSVPAPPEGDAYNMVRMEDAAGGEMLELRAQRDFKSETLRNADTIVGVDEKKKVGGSSATEVTGAYSMQSASTTISTGPYEVSSTTTKISSTGNMKLSAGGARRDESQNHNVDTGGFWVNAGDIVQIVAPTVKVMAGEILLEGGGSTIVINGGGIFINGKVVDVKGAPIKLNC